MQQWLISFVAHQERFPAKGSLPKSDKITENSRDTLFRAQPNSFEKYISPGILDLLLEAMKQSKDKQSS
jgi:hypothetical protein